MIEREDERYREGKKEGEVEEKMRTLERNLKVLNFHLRK